MASNLPVYQAQPVRRETLGLDPGRRSVVLDANPLVVGFGGGPRGFPDEGPSPKE